MMPPETPATREVAASGLEHRIVEYGRVSSLEEAAAKRGVPVEAVMKSMVVRVGKEDFVMVIVPGDRVIDWPKLRANLGAARMSLAREDEALEVTGYRRGAITPFGSVRRLPLILDASATGEISLGGGDHGVSIHLDATDLAAHFDATVVDVTKPAG